jgi:hypothetical protein
MRVAAMAFVLVVGAAVVLVFANTLNSWVLGGLLGGLAAILLSIPISLVLFTFLARRHDARQKAAAQAFENEPDSPGDGSYDHAIGQDARGYALSADKVFGTNPRTRAHSSPERHRLPVSGFLSLPPVEQDLDSYEDEPGTFARRDPRNYPRHSRYSARPLARDDDLVSPSPRSKPPRDPSTRSLAEHKSAALRQAREEAQQQIANNHHSLSRASRGTRPSRIHGSHSTRPPSNRILDENHSRLSRSRNAQPAWDEDENGLRDSITEQYPRRPSYPRKPRASRSVDPWTDTLEEEDDQIEPGWSRRPRDPERISGTLRNPLVRRAPYLYDDDPLREELAQQLESDRPIRRRSSLYERYEDDEE